jgi:myo-inositol 2-dehydrogenase/D-chiro-inositol 1-dehydrogenase
MNNGVLNFGLIGAGRIGKLHAQNLATRVRGVRLLAVADVNRAAAEHIADDWNIPNVTDDFRVVLDDDSIDAVLIASSTDTHAPMIEQAALAGKHIFCEKPISFDLAAIERSLSAVDKAGVKLQIGFNRRFDANFLQARSLIQQGRVGRLHLLHIISRDPSPPPLDYIRVSGGLFLDMTIHDFDMARYLTGSEVKQVYAMGDVRIDPQIGEAGDIDTAVTLLRFEDGVIGTIDNSRGTTYGYDQRVEVFGSGGAVTVSNEAPDRTTISDAQGIHNSLPYYFFLERYSEAYVTELRSFVQALREDKQPLATGQDGRIAVIIGLAAKKSLDENRPVDVAEVEMQYA